MILHHVDISGYIIYTTYVQCTWLLKKDETFQERRRFTPAGIQKSTMKSYPFCASNPSAISIGIFVEKGH